MDNNQNNQPQAGGQYYGQPDMNQGNSYGQPQMNQGYQGNPYGQPQMNQGYQGNPYGQPQMNQGYQYNQYQGQPQMGYQNYQMAPAVMTKKEFFKTRATSNVKSNITSSAVILYICAAINFFYHYVYMVNTGAILDCILLLALGLCVQLLYSRIAAIIATVYSIISAILYLYLYGKLGGWLIIIAGVCACIGTFGLEKEYKNFTSYNVRR
ncbi:MAG: hypothetical protein IJZ96_02355 [Lachnospiraceae bacterium]|nr:hypothetical protein [Lachnospiraceae bacterium]